MMQNRRAFILSAAALSAAPAWAQGVSGRTCYTFEFGNFEGPPMRLGDFADKPVLVVNTASLCGYTPQYAGLQKLWEKMGPRGLVMIGAPCNDFGGQEPGGRAEIIATVENYKVTFPIVAKVAVKGPEAHPFYRWAAMERPRETPQWNFHKYLVGRDGHIAASIPTTVDPLDPRVLTAIEKEFSSGPA